MQHSYHTKQSASLNHANTMALCCCADELVTFTEEAQICQFLHGFHTRPSKNNLLVLSGGSNVLLPPKLQACVLQPMLKGVSLIKETADTAYVQVMAGENWHDWVMTSIKNGWYGLENLALIPGLVGAAPVQNIGAYGVECSDFFEQLTAINLQTAQSQVFNKADCTFAYRDSLFKQQPNTWLITKVVFKLHKTPKLMLNYGDVAALATEKSTTNQPTPQSVADAVIHIRQSKLPNPKDIANTGSFFKNPVVNAERFTALQQQFPNMPHYLQENGQIKLAAGWLIDQAGLKGFQQGNIGTHAKQALVVVNHAPAVSTQNDIANFSHIIQTNILEKYGIHLEREPVWITEQGLTE